VVFAITVCALAVHTGAVRLMFAMARDNNLPFGRALARVSGASHTPLVPAVIAGLLAAAILVANVGFPNVVEVVTSVAILWANLAYLLVTVLLLRQRLGGWPPRGGPGGRGPFSLGRWGLPVNVLAVGWGVLMVANIGWPRADAGAAWHQRYAALLFTGGLVAVGATYYGLVQRHRTGVLEEHRAPAPAGDRPPPDLGR
jgi:amino acid transporter